MRFIDQEQELGRDIPKVFGNADYKEYRGQLEQIDVLLIQSGMETRFVERCLEDWMRTGQRIGTRARLRYQKLCIQALRCNIARQLTEREYRKFARRLAESAVLQKFCRVEQLAGVSIPSKSTMERFDKLASEGEIRDLVNVLLGKVAGETHGELGLEAEVGIEVLLVDTCLLYTSDAADE